MRSLLWIFLILLVIFLIKPIGKVEGYTNPDHYKNLPDMTPSQIIKFKKKAHLDKMSINDYSNWLSLFEHDLENLPKQHYSNYEKYISGEAITDIPIEEEEADSKQIGERVCINVPNIEVDSPLNYKFSSHLATTGKINKKGETERSLNWSKHFGYQAGKRKEEVSRSNQIKAGNWFGNNTNWLFSVAEDNPIHQDPNKNRFMNVISSQNVPTTSIKSGVAATAKAYEEWDKNTDEKL